MECTLRTGRPRLRGLALAACSLAPAVAFAADNGLYLGGATSDVSSDYATSSAAGFAPDEDGLKLIGGVRPLDAFAIEANYADFGAARVPLTVACITVPCPTEGTIDSRALSVSAVGLFAFPFVDVYGRAGIARWESERQLAITEDVAGTDPTYGAGVQVRLGSFALRLEYERFELGGDAVDMRSIGFTYTLL